MTDNERGYEYLISEISINANYFRSSWEDETKLSGQVWGMFDYIEGHDYCLVYTSKFNEMCYRGNISPKAFVKWADKKKLLYKNNGQSCKNYIYKKRTNGILSNFYALKMPNDFNLEEFKQMIDSECPFA